MYRCVVVTCKAGWERGEKILLEKAEADWFEK